MRSKKSELASGGQARRLCRIKGWKRVDLDNRKFGFYGDHVKDGDLAQRNWDLVYWHIYKKIEDQLSRGAAVVHHTGNFTKDERDMVRDIAKRLGLRAQVIWISTPESVARKTMLANRKSAERFDVSDADFINTVNEFEPPDSTEDFLPYDIAITPGDWVARNLNR